MFGIWYLFILADLVFAAFTAYIASEKGYNTITWVWLGILFSLVAFFAAIGLPNKKLSS